MSISHLLNRAVAAACVLALGVCGARAADPYRIHVILPLTGGAAFLGKGEQQALTLAYNDVLLLMAGCFLVALPLTLMLAKPTGTSAEAH